MENIEKRLNEARPRLSVVSPLVNAIIWGFVFTNLLLGIGLIISSGTTTSRLPVVTDFFSLKFYGIVFLTLGLAMFYGQAKNDWHLLKATLVVGVLLKSIWLYALAYLVFNGGSITLLAMWAFFTFIQAATYVYFTPGLRRKDDK
jgi:hypothetical protein